MKEKSMLWKMQWKVKLRCISYIIHEALSSPAFNYRIPVSRFYHHLSVAQFVFSFSLSLYLSSWDSMTRATLEALQPLSNIMNSLSQCGDSNTTRVTVSLTPFTGQSIISYSTRLSAQKRLWQKYHSMKKKEKKDKTWLVIFLFNTIICAYGIFIPSSSLPHVKLLLCYKIHPPTKPTPATIISANAQQFNFYFSAVKIVMTLCLTRRTAIFNTIQSQHVFIWNRLNKLFSNKPFFLAIFFHFFQGYD